MPQSEVFRKEKEFSNEPRCLHPLATEDCGKRIIAAHTVQKRIGLKSIEENGHVLSFRRSVGATFKSDGEFVPERQGVQGASTFRGFCDKHDAELFRPIETQAWKATKENAFLLSFRGVAYEVYAKLAAQKIAKWIKSWIDLGCDFPVQAAHQQSLEDHLTGVSLAVRDQTAWKASYDRMYKSGDYTDYHYLCIEFRPALPIVACGGMHVEWDFNGKMLQNLVRQSSTFDHLTFNITAVDDISVVTFGWIGDRDSPSYHFLQSLLSQPTNRLSHAVMRMAFEVFENTFMRQGWWDGLSDAIRRSIQQRALSGLPDNDHTALSLVEDHVDYFSAQPSIVGIIL